MNRESSGMLATDGERRDPLLTALRSGVVFFEELLFVLKVC